MLGVSIEACCFVFVNYMLHRTHIILPLDHNTAILGSNVQWKCILPVLGRCCHCQGSSNYHWYLGWLRLPIHTLLDSTLMWTGK